MTLPLSVTSWALPPARLSLEKDKIPLGIAGAGKGFGGRSGGEEGRCMYVCPVLVYLIYAVLSPGCVYCIRFFVVVF